MRYLTMVIVVAAPAAWAAPGSMWNSSFNQGVTEYLTGEWDRTTGGALSLSCKDGQASIAAQIAGKTPPGGSELLITTSSRTGVHEHRYTTNPRGSVEMPAAALAPFWTRLRADDTLTLRYADGRTTVLSLDGASRTLPPKPCG